MKREADELENICKRKKFRLLNSIEGVEENVKDESSKITLLRNLRNANKLGLKMK